MIAFCLLLCLYQGPPAPMTPTQLNQEIRALIHQKQFDEAFWGVAVYAPVRGKYLVEENLNRNFRPASNLKILTTLLAFEKLGTDYQFRTTVGYTGTRNQGTVEGDLCIRAGGDPSFSGRYTKFWSSKDLLDRLARSIADSGIKHVEGNLVADLSFFDDRAIQYSWEWDDLGSYYAVPITPLSLNDGLFDFVLQADRDGLIDLSVWPSGTPDFSWTDHTHPDAESGLEFKRPWGTDSFTLQGHLPACATRRVSQAAWDPSQQFLFALRQALAEAGVTLSGKLQQSAEPIQWDNDLVYWDSEPLELLARVLMKESQNHYADAFFKTVAREVTGEGSFEAAASVALEWLGEVLPGTKGAQLLDGSGMSSQNNLSPAQFSALLRHAYSASYFESFMASLPIMGEDGTLQRRGTPDTRAHVWAKTGYINRARNLAGYAETQSGEPLIFVLLANNYGCSTKEVELAQDKICGLLRQLIPDETVKKSKDLFILSRIGAGYPPHSYPLDAGD